tara:strand:- start:1358 stop:2140 length:783 start_codon:yes stop_codon:yes gene_type:complete
MFDYLTPKELEFLKKTNYLIGGFIKKQVTKKTLLANLKSKALRQEWLQQGFSKHNLAKVITDIRQYPSNKWNGPVSKKSNDPSNPQEGRILTLRELENFEKTSPGTFCKTTYHDLLKFQKTQKIFYVYGESYGVSTLPLLTDNIKSCSIIVLYDGTRAALCHTWNCCNPRKYLDIVIPKMKRPIYAIVIGYNTQPDKNNEDDIPNTISNLRHACKDYKVILFRAYTLPWIAYKDVLVIPSTGEVRIYVKTNKPIVTFFPR